MTNNKTYKFELKSPKGNHVIVSYWLKRLKEDENMIIYASSKAEKASNYILNNK